MTSASICHRDRVKALLAFATEAHLSGAITSAGLHGIESPWDLWWICFRAGESAQALGLDPARVNDQCGLCLRDVITLTGYRPTRDPDTLGFRGCDCIHQWAVRMRQPATEISWPELRTTVAMVKPGGDPDEIRHGLLATHAVIHETERTLTKHDVRRLYPDAYGAEFVAAQDAHLTNGPVHIMVLLANPGITANAKQIKTALRDRMGSTDVLRNNLHMPDNPGDAICDVAHLGGLDILNDLYGRYDRDTCQQRLHGYRALLAQW